MYIKPDLRALSMALLVFATLSCTANAGNKPQEEEPVQTEQVDTTHRLSLLFAGDLMQHGVQYRAALQPDGTYSYEECFRYVKEDVSSVDLAIANFETTLNGAPYSTYPRFNSPDDYFYAIQDAGFDVMLTANNHSVDTRASGIARTIKVMDEANMPHVGTYVDAEARKQQYPLFIDRNGIRLALLNFTYGTNGIPVPAPCIVNSIDTTQIRADIQKAKRYKADVIIACVHWGIEHALTPNADQKKLADWMFENGVDHIIGGHPHVVQPSEVRTDSRGNKHLLVYSLGNYISNMSKPNNEGGMMVKMELVKEDGTTRLDSCAYSLIWVSRPAVSGHKNYRIYPVSVPQTMLNAAEKASFNRTLTTERNLFQKHNKGGIREYEIKCSLFDKK